MLLPQLAALIDVSLLALRLMVAVVFVASGANDLRDPEARSRSMGVSRAFAVFLGWAEVLGGLGVAGGVLIRLAALGLIVIMLGAIQKKATVWHTGFWGKDASGWHYDLMLATMSFVIVATGGGSLVLLG